MISNRVKRNIFLTLAIMSVITVIDRAIRLAMGLVEWWILVLAIAITAVLTKCYFSFRREVKRGNLFGHVNIFK